MAEPAHPRQYRFGLFELDCRSGDLRKEGALHRRLQEQPLRALLALLENAGAVVTREELRARVWPDQTFVDFDHGLNSIVNRLRDTLGDKAESALFIQTLPRRGYRFIAPVVRIESDSAAPAAAVGASPPAARSDARPPGAVAPAVGATKRRRLTGAWVALLALLAVLATVAVIVRRVIPIRPGPDIAGVRVAVLPFDNLTGDAEQAVFVDGLHEELIFRLGRLHPQRMAVIARTSVLPYRESRKTIAEIASDLSVGFVLEGSVRRASGRFRITAQLIRGDDQSHVWTETYERTWSDLLSLQQDIAVRVADALTLELLPRYQAQIARDATVDSAAYEEYLRGRFYWNQRTRDPAGQLARARAHFENAIRLQPDYAPAYVGLADTHDSLAFSGVVPAAEAFPKAKAAVQRALQIDPELPSAHATLAYMTMHFEWDWRAAANAFERALDLDPNDALTRLRYGQLLAVQGRFTDADEQMAAARRLDPLAYHVPETQAWLSWQRGAGTQALLQMREAAELDGNLARLRTFSAYVAAARGECDSAREALNALRAAADAFPIVSDATYAAGRCGDPALQAAVRRELASDRRSFALATFHLGAGDRDGFFTALDQALDERSPEAIWVGADPIFDPVRADPRYAGILQRLHLR